MQVLDQGIQAGQVSDLMGKIGIDPSLMRCLSIFRRDFERLNQRRDGLAPEDGDLFANGGDLEYGTPENGPVPGRTVGLRWRSRREGCRVAGKRREEAADSGIAEIARGKRTNPQHPNPLAPGIGECDRPGAVQKPRAVELGGLDGTIDHVDGLIEVSGVRRDVGCRWVFQQQQSSVQILKTPLNRFNAVRREPKRRIHPAKFVQDFEAVFGMRLIDARVLRNLLGEMADSQVRSARAILARARRTAIGPDATGE